MRRPGPRSHPEVMNTSTVNPEPGTAQPDRRTEPSGPAALRRPFAGRMLAGVAEGLARYFGVDATLVRIAFVVLTIVGGAGIPLYLAGLLLIPDEGTDQSIVGSLLQSLSR